MNITKADKKIIKDAKIGRFWELVLQYIDEEIEAMNTGIISWLDEDMSKTKRNDRDLLLQSKALWEGVKELPERLLTLLENQDQN